MGGVEGLNVLHAITEVLGAVAPLAEAGGHGAIAEGPWWGMLIPFIPLFGTVLVGILAASGNTTKLPAYASVGLLGVSFALTVAMWAGWQGQPVVIHAFEWLNLSWGEGPGQSFAANFSFYMDGLSLLWMLFVTGLATLICLYASEYMSHDVGLGYCRFFAAFNLFVFSMSCLVMGDNMVLLFLGWEGVGLCSYLLIGYFYKKKAAVDAGQKAFVVNRIGDLGLLLGVLLTFTTFGTVEFGPLFEMINAGVTADGTALAATWQSWGIPLLLIGGAFGKSAQLFFYVWLPDAMEGPTPVSALIHAATMVTAGVYLVARMTPLFLADEDRIALTVVAWGGTITAFWAATIAMAQFDIKRIMGYSTISQLGYMFAGLGFLASTGGVFHVLTHAFFKATLFLACGAVMHGFAGQLDMRRLSGLGKLPGWQITTFAMLIGCLNLAGFPFTAGYFSKDMILAEAFVHARRGDLGLELGGLGAAAHGGADGVLHVPRVLPCVRGPDALRARRRPPRGRRAPRRRGGGLRARRGRRSRARWLPPARAGVGDESRARPARGWVGPGGGSVLRQQGRPRVDRLDGAPVLGVRARGDVGEPRQRQRHGLRCGGHG
jgi:NADH-quinone oxidoreductase subunit L